MRWPWARSSTCLSTPGRNFFDSVIRHLIAGNVLRGQAYPLCVGAERGLQAARLAELAQQRGATTVAHGCTVAGNDQVRFEVALRTLGPGLEVLAPVRDNSWVREEQLAYLEQHSLPLPAQGTDYSINRGLWGITIGGRETLTSENAILSTTIFFILVSRGPRLQRAWY